MSKRRRGWRQAANRCRRALRLRKARRQVDRSGTTKSYFSQKVHGVPLVLLAEDADYDVHVACRDQLTRDGRRPPHDPSGTMDKHYRYQDIDGYLTAVRRRLADKNRQFDFDHAWAIDHLSDELIELEGAIVGKLK